MRTFTGLTVDPTHLKSDGIDVEDIAHALANLCRFGGHSSRFYSVAQHSVLVALSVPPADAMWGLLHDATEAYLGDVIMPLKQQLPTYRAMEHVAQLAVAERFGLPREIPESVHTADMRMLATEARDIVRNGVDLRHIPTAKPYGHFVIEPWSPRDAKIEFLRTFEAIVQGIREGVA